MELIQIVKDIADVLKNFDSEHPIHKNFSPGIGPFGEPQLIKEISNRLNSLDDLYQTQIKRTPDLVVNGQWAVEFKIVRPFGDNGDIAENWSVNMLHPYEGNTSLIGDAIKLNKLTAYSQKAVILIGFEHLVPLISLDPLVASFEVIIQNVICLNISPKIEEKRIDLVHPQHQIVRIIGWEIL